MSSSLEMPMLTVVVVLYNKKFNESATLVSLSKQIITFDHAYKVKLVLYDNSPVSCSSIKDFSSFEAFSEIEINHSPENLPLSVIYNTVISHSSKINTDFLWLDDDTLLPTNYISEVTDKIKSFSDIDLFVPVVQVNNKNYSPYKSYLFFSRPINKLKLGINSSRFIGAINSGMVIRGDFFRKTKFRYPADIYFYGTDKVFMDEYSKYRCRFYILNSTLSHDVTVHPDNKDIGSYIAAMKKVDSFWKVYYKKNKLILIFYKVYFLFFVLKSSIRNRSCVFFKLLSDKDVL